MMTTTMTTMMMVSGDGDDDDDDDEDGDGDEDTAIAKIHATRQRDRWIGLAGSARRQATRHESSISGRGALRNCRSSLNFAAQSTLAGVEPVLQAGLPLKIAPL